MATCNEAERLLRVEQGALFRDGRFDGVVFFDLPDRQSKDGMWQIYSRMLPDPEQQAKYAGQGSGGGQHRGLLPASRSV